MTLAAHILAALGTAEPEAKCQKTRKIWQQMDAFTQLGEVRGLQDRPAREARPNLIAPAQVPRRAVTRGTKGRFALLHALAHIELNAVNLALDMAVRFGGDYGFGFVKDWLSVAEDEAKHFLLIQDRLIALGGKYGDLDAHDGLWEAAVATKDQSLARLAVVPMVLEARGLDVTPAMIEKLSSVDDHESVAALKIIYADEVGHVAIGRKWFEHACALEGLEPETTWQAQVKAFFTGVLRRPFNEPARTAAGMQPAYYEPLADWYEAMGF